MFWHQSVYLSTLSGGVPGLRFSGGVPRSQIFGGGVPGLRFSEGGSQVSDFWEGCPKSHIFRGGVPGLIFLGGRYLVSVKGKVFDTRFGLIHVQTRKIFLLRDHPPPPSKGKKFWHQIWLDTCSDWEKKIFVKGPPPPAIARNCYGYAAGGMPLAFTQEDFLVINISSFSY